MIFVFLFWSLPGGSDSKESSCNVGNPGSIPGLWRSPGEGNGNPLQYSCLGNPMDREVYQARVHRITKSWTQLTNTFTLSLPDLLHSDRLGLSTSLQMAQFHSFLWHMSTNVFNMIRSVFSYVDLTEVFQGLIDKSVLQRWNRDTFWNIDTCS